MCGSVCVCVCVSVDVCVCVSVCGCTRVHITALDLQDTHFPILVVWIFYWQTSTACVFCLRTLLCPLDCSLPDNERTPYTIYDYYVDESGEWELWANRLVLCKWMAGCKTCPEWKCEMYKLVLVIPTGASGQCELAPNTALKNDRIRLC